MKKYYFLVMALAALMSCSSDEFVGDSGSPNGVNGSGAESAISFNYELQKITRAESDHVTSAANLGNQFIVWGEKNDATTGDTKDKYADGSLVFPNYKVEYTSNTAYTTTSNTKDWEYVGLSKTSNYASNITYKDVVTPADAVAGTTDAQTIKYWDYNANSYTFTAVSASKLTNSKTDIENGYIKIQKNINDATSPFNKGYLVQVYSGADLSKLYFSDRKVIEKSAGTDRNASNAYGGNVTLKFRNALSHVRAGIYETIPGYAISDITFKVTSNAVAQVGSTDAFGAICPNIKSGSYTEDLKVTYESADVATKNQPIVTPVKRSDGTAAATTADLILGTNISTINTTNLLKTTAADPTWDTSGGTYTAVLPQAGNESNLKLKCSYTLYNASTGETINVTDKTAEVPYKYLQWKPNYKYTYLFKITDDDLYPITFDAVEIVNGDGLAEYITTVSEPSITTFGVKGGVYIAEHGTALAYFDYPASTAVYATVMDGSSLATLSTSNMQLYTVITSDATNFPITEASVAEALIEGPTLNTAQATAAKIKLPTNPDLTYQKTVPAEDGTTITLDADNNKAATFNTAASTTYALVYQKEAATYTVDSGKNDYTAETYDAAGTLYTDAECTTKATSFTSGTTYYKRTSVANKGKYVIKIVTCP